MQASRRIGFDARAFGRALALRRPPLCPEIALWLVDEAVDLEAECGLLRDGEAPPYWAFCWGAGQALARYLLDHPDEVSGRRVVDFGAGSGIAGIAAARAGASRVTCVDLDPTARAAAHANAEGNGVAAEVLDASSTIPAAWDVFLACDVVYEHPATASVRAQRARHPAGSVLVAEPHRPGNPGWDHEALARYEVKTFPDVDSPTVAASVYRLS